MNTKIRGNTQIMDYTIDLSRLQQSFINSSTGDWNITNGAQDALITGLKLQPINDADASSKWYVDQKALYATEWKFSVQFATSTGGVGVYTSTGGVSGTGAFTNVNFTGASVFDLGGHTVLVGDRVLVKNQADAKQNGIYTVTSTGAAGGLERALDQDGTPSAEVSIGNATYIENVTSGATGTHWVVVKPLGYDGSGVLVLNVDNIEWTQFSGIGTYTAGAAIDISGTQISVKYDNTTIGVNGSNQLEVKSGVFAPFSHSHVAANITDFDEAAQDAVGGILTDTTSIDFNYDDLGNQITATVIVSSTGGLEITASGVGIKANGVKDSMIYFSTSTGGVSGVDIPLQDVGNYFAIDNVEDALQQVGAALASNYAFGTFVPTAGAPIVADTTSDTATLTASDGAIKITGIALSDTLDFTITSTGIKDYMIAWGTSTGQVSAGDIPVLDTANYFSIDNVEAALAQLAAATPGVGYTVVVGELPTLNTNLETATLLHSPISGSEQVYLNGVRQISGLSYDYTLATNVITFTAPGLRPGDIVVVDYRYL